MAGWIGALLGLVAALPAAAQDPRGFQWEMNGRPAPADPAQATRAGFGVLMMFTNDSERFFKAWAGPTPPNLPSTEQVTRARPVHVMLIFSGCRAGAGGNCRVSAEYSITGPDGAPFGKPAKAPVWDGAPAPGYNLQLSLSSIGFSLEPEDKLGTYRVQAIVTDEIAGTQVTVVKPLVAKED